MKNGSTAIKSDNAQLPIECFKKKETKSFR